MAATKTLNFYRWKGHIKSTLTCAVCGKEFTTFPSAIKRGKKYCSTECYYVSRKGWNAGEKNYGWKGGPVKRGCMVCGGTFHVNQEQIKRTGAKFCSNSCRSLYNVRYNHGKTDTDIERITETILINLNIPYEKQVPVKGVAVVDFLVNDRIIQCDGDYWHSLPLTKERDRRQDVYLSQHGYSILRLLGSEIKKQPEVCVDKIKTFLTVETRADNVGLRGNQ